MTTMTADTRVMEHDAAGHGLDIGTVAEWRRDWARRLTVGDSQGEDTARGAYDWWPVLEGRQIVAELRDDATGLTVHVDA